MIDPDKEPQGWRAAPRVRGFRAPERVRGFKRKRKSKSK
jgi:hypothetical protein